MSDPPSYPVKGNKAVFVWVLPGPKRAPGFLASLGDGPAGPGTGTPPPSLITQSSKLRGTLPIEKHNSHQSPTPSSLFCSPFPVNEYLNDMCPRGVYRFSPASHESSNLHMVGTPKWLCPWPGRKLRECFTLIKAYSIQSPLLNAMLGSLWNGKRPADSRSTFQRRCILAESFPGVDIVSLSTSLSSAFPKYPQWTSRLRCLTNSLSERIAEGVDSVSNSHPSQSILATSTKLPKDMQGAAY